MKTINISKCMATLQRFNKCWYNVRCIVLEWYRLYLYFVVFIIFPCTICHSPKIQAVYGLRRFGRVHYITLHVMDPSAFSKSTYMYSMNSRARYAIVKECSFQFKILYITVAKTTMCVLVMQCWWCTYVNKV